MIETAATLFSGGGGSDIGLSNAGLKVLWGIEKDAAIVSVAKENGLRIEQGDVTEEHPSDWQDVDLLHASPPCPNFSVAKTNGKETDEDVSLAEATCKFIRGIEPKAFTLENVWGYRKSRSWKLIRQYLSRNGYDWNAWKLNAANFGCPQTRKRMIVSAIRGGPRPTKPKLTHAKEPQNGGLFGDNKEQWVGWYEAIDDLVDGLPETELADWQKKRLPDELVRTTIVDTQPNARGDCRSQEKPTKTVAADPAGGLSRAVLVHGQQTTQVDSGKWADGEAITRDGGEPVYPVTATSYKGTGRVVLVQNGNEWSPVAEGDRPSPTLPASGDRTRPARAVIDDSRRRVVQMTPRALARFQTLPDWYGLPDKKSLACKIIGNAVPPLLMQRITESLINDIE